VNARLPRLPSTSTWGLALLVQVVILLGGIALMGAEFAEVSFLHAPVINLLLWTGFITLAGLAASAASGRFHRRVGYLLMALAIAWFPISVLIFGNARFSGTSALLWGIWWRATGLLILTSLVSQAISATSALLARR